MHRPYFLPDISYGSSPDDLARGVADARDELARAAGAGIRAYLGAEERRGVFARFPEALARVATASALEWIESPAIDRYTKLGLLRAIAAERWEDICSAHRDRVKFGTAGPRQMAALTFSELLELRERGFRADILKGPNTINSVTIALLTTGVARYCRERGKRRVVITYDSRVFGRGFADLVASIFLRELDDEAAVHVFDESSPMPEMSYSVAHLRADLGILISASHNPERYNGYKVATETGAQLDPVTRKEVEAAIYGTRRAGGGGASGDGASGGVTLDDVAEVLAFAAALPEPLELSDLAATPPRPGALIGRFTAERPRRLVVLAARSSHAGERGFPHIDIHGPHARHVRSHVLTAPERGLCVVHCAFYGNGEKALARAIATLDLEAPRTVREYARLDGTFPRFSGHVVDGKPRPLIPDPGNSAGHARAWSLVIDDFIAQEGGVVEAFRGVDLLVGTDPDADRLGVVSPIRAEEVPQDARDREVQLIPWVVPVAHRRALGFGGLRLLSANDAWTLIVKYRIDRFVEMRRDGRLPAGLRFGIVKTHVTTGALDRLTSYAATLDPPLDIELVEPSVGFSLVAEAIRAGWERGVINLAGAEESGGFSIGGAPPIFFTLLGLFARHEGWTIDTRSLAIEAPDPLLAVDDGSYFAYTGDEVRSTLEFLRARGVVVPVTSGSTRLCIAPRLETLRASHEEFWHDLRPLAAAAPGERLGKRGHTMEKDGLLAAVLAVEVAGAAKARGLSLDAFLREEIYLDGTIGYFATTNQALEFPNTVAGTQEKLRVLERALALAREVGSGRDIDLARRRVSSVEVFIPASPKYADVDAFPTARYRDLLPLLAALGRPAGTAEPPSFFPEEGVRFGFGPASGRHLTIRPSGTENKLRFYVEWRADPAIADLTARMLDADSAAYDVAVAAMDRVRRA